MTARFARLDTVSVLLIADDSTADELLAHRLDEAGVAFDITRVDSVPAARAALACAIPDCILLDLGRPKAAGLEALHDIEAQAPSTPIVLLTGSEDEAFALTAVKGGAHDFVTRGRINGEAMRNAIQHAIEGKRIEAELRHRALHDPLTGLGNRALFFERVQCALERLADEPGRVGLVFADVDGFKQINDTAGHITGDAVLVEIAGRLRATLGPGDVVARLGGDEFAILRQHIGDPAQLDAVPAQLAATIATPPLVVAGHTVTLSVGTAWTDDPAIDPDELVRRADAAMYRSKQAVGEANRKTRRRPRPTLAPGQPFVRELMQHAATTLADLLGDTCLTWQLSDDRRWLHAVGIADRDIHLTSLLRDVSSQSLAADALFVNHALTTGASVRMQTISSQALLDRRPELAAYAMRFAIRGLLEVPIWYGGRALGLVTIVRRRSKPLDADEEHLVHTFADFAAVAIATTTAAATPKPAPAALETEGKDRLSARERDILGLLALGHTNREIAERVVLSVRTVEWYRARIQWKLGVSGRAALADAARSLQVVD